MIRHVVMWRLKENAGGRTKQENLELMKARIERLADLVPGIVSLEVGIDFDRSDTAADLVLISSFMTRADLDAYQSHPEHRNVVGFVREVTSERRVVDYEGEDPGGSLVE